MLKIGLIGNGSIARAHLSAYKRLYESGIAEVVAFCDIRPERLEKQYLNCFDRARTYTSIDEMLKEEAEKLDFVDICTPTFLHSEHAVKAMESGVNCLSEKPMARTVKEAEKMIETANKTGKLLMIAHCCRFHAAAYKIKKLIETKELGKVVNADFRREGGGDDGSSWFREYALSGSAPLDYHIHDVDLIRWMFGVPNAVSSSGVNCYSIGGGYDVISTNFIYDNMFVNANCSWQLRKNRFNVRMMRVNFENGYVYVERGGERDVAVIVKKDGTESYFSEMLPLDGYYEEIKYFANIVAKGIKPEFNPPEDSIDAVKIVMAEIESADKNGERITL